MGYIDSIMILTVICLFVDSNCLFAFAVLTVIICLLFLYWQLLSVCFCCIDSNCLFVFAVLTVNVCLFLLY